MPRASPSTLTQCAPHCPPASPAAGQYVGLCIAMCVLAVFTQVGAPATCWRTRHPAHVCLHGCSVQPRASDKAPPASPPCPASSARVGPSPHLPAPLPLSPDPPPQHSILRSSSRPCACAWRCTGPPSPAPRPAGATPTWRPAAASPPSTCRWASAPRAWQPSRPPSRRPRPAAAPPPPPPAATAAAARMSRCPLQTGASTGCARAALEGRARERWWSTVAS